MCGQATVWWSTVHLGMGQHPAVLAVMIDAVSEVGAGTRNSRAEKQVIRHRDPTALEPVLARLSSEPAKLGYFDPVCSVDRDVAPIGKFCDIADRDGPMARLDEVHTVRLLDPRGGGSAECDGGQHRPTVIQGTPGNAFGPLGGYIAGRAAVVDVIRSHTPGCTFATSLPPAMVAATLAATNELKHSQAERDLHQDRATTVRKRLLAAGLPVMPSQRHTGPALPGGPYRCSALSEARRHEPYVQRIGYPAMATTSGK